MSAMPTGTFGRCYADFMRGHTFSPDERCATRFVDDSELAYVMTRAREMHDFLHVLCGLEPDVPGEIALKWFEMVHTGLPVAAFSDDITSLSASVRSRMEPVMLSDGLLKLIVVGDPVFVPVS